MTRSSRLMATMLAAVFTAVLAAPAYATGSAFVVRLAAPYGSGCKAEGTKFHDLERERQARRG